MLPKRKEFCLPHCLGHKTASTLARISRLPALSTDFGFARPHNHVSQFPKRNLFLYIGSVSLEDPHPPPTSHKIEMKSKPALLFFMILEVLSITLSVLGAQCGPIT